MSFLAKATLSVIVVLVLIDGLWDLQATHPWRACALVFIALGCVFVIEVTRKRNR